MSYLDPQQNRPLGELELQQALNIQQLIDGAKVVGMYVPQGESVSEDTIDMIMEDLQAITQQEQ